MRTTRFFALPRGSLFDIKRKRTARQDGFLLEIKSMRTRIILGVDDSPPVEKIYFYGNNCGGRANFVGRDLFALALTTERQKLTRSKPKKQKTDRPLENEEIRRQ